MRVVNRILFGYVVTMAAVGAQAFTAADSGWVRLFNGTDFNGFYSRLYAAPVTHPVDTSAFSIVYPGTDTACIRAKNTSKKGELGTDRTNFSHYRTRMEYRFDVASSGYNAGLLYGVDETAIRMQNNWPRGFEFQMQQSEPGSVYSIQQVTATTKATSGAYNPTGSTVQVCEYGCNARSYKGSPVIPSAIGTTPKWMRIELIQRGSDSAIHIVNDTVVMRIWNIRIFNDSTKKTGGTTTSGGATLSNMTPPGPYPSGALAIEGEGALINHRRWAIMEFPASTPMNEHFLHRLFLWGTDSRWGYWGSSGLVQWVSIGTIPKVKIEFKDITAENSPGNWQTVSDSVPNTGSWTWANWRDGIHYPTTFKIRLRVSSSDWVWGDSLDINIDYADAILQPGIHGTLAFSVPKSGPLLTGLVAGSRIEIQNAAGQRIRVLTLGEESTSWDLADAKGRRVPPGLYFLRVFQGKTAYRTGRVQVD